jgi:hypothetical protein
MNVLQDRVKTRCISSLLDPSCIASLKQPQRKISLFSFDENCVDGVFGECAEAFIWRLPLIVGENAPGNLGAMENAIQKGYYFWIGNYTENCVE